MAAIKISSKVDEKVWKEFRDYAEQSHSMISGLLTQALREFLQRRRVRPDVMQHLQDSIEDNRELGRRLAE